MTAGNVPTNIANKLAAGNIGDAITAPSPETVALVQTGEDSREITYGDFLGRVRAVQGWLDQLGIKQGEHVAIIGLNSIEWLAAFYGIMRAGAVAVPVSHKFPASVLDYVLENSESELVLTDREDRVPGTELPVHLLSEINDLPDVDVAPATVALDDPAMVLYTSGSTGRPKGVVRSHGSHVWIMEQGELASDGKYRTILVSAPLYHMNGLATVQGAFLHGDRVVLQPAFDSKGFLHAIADHKVTKLTGVPPMMALALRERELLDTLDFSSVTEQLFGSAPLTDELISDIEAVFPYSKLTISYGTTETGPVAFSPHPDGIPSPINSTGVAHRAVKVRLLDGNGNVIVQDGLGGDLKPETEVVGNLALSAPGELIDYLNRPDLVRPIDAEGYYVTGDLFRRDTGGFYYFNGRVDDMFTSGGENVHPVAVEATLLENPEVKEAAVVPVADKLKGAKPVAFVVRQPGSQVSEQELKDWVLGRMEPYAHPRRVLFIESLPLSGTNKVDKNVLAREAAELIGEAK
ncbi:MAG: class I adenylate-forming enzyme family protein [Flaviflexus sp.]|uniref:class I adenylate-forming enzyme family protein n=1 Tax=Flaviflexus sp. TaxID=1969482 RepID=UPI00352F6C82